MRVFIILAIAALVGLLVPDTANRVQAQDTDEFAFSTRGDAAKGRRLFARCRACHNLTSDARPRTGPNLDEIFGRTAGTSESFTRYSNQIKDSGIVWSEETMDAWLSNPRALIPGNRMTFVGLRREQDRLDMIAYLREATIPE